MTTRYELSTSTTVPTYTDLGDSSTSDPAHRERCACGSRSRDVTEGPRPRCAVSASFSAGAAQPGDSVIRLAFAIVLSMPSCARLHTGGS